jgi:hypothetical protein
MKLPLLVALLVPLSVSAVSDPDSEYQKHSIQGWTVQVHQDLTAQTELCAEVLDLLGAKLYEIRARVPKSAVERLQKVTIWMHRDRQGCPGGVYHPSKQWLVEHDLNPDMAQSVEFGNAQNFLSWMNTQPSMVMHEMAHAFHHQVLTYEHVEIKAAYEAAQLAKSYDAVLYAHGDRKVAYAMNNPMEYFAEASEAWFGVNDFYPFVRAEFREHDAQLAGIMDGVWSSLEPK